MKKIIRNITLLVVSVLLCCCENTRQIKVVGNYSDFYHIMRNTNNTENQILAMDSFSLILPHIPSNYLVSLAEKCSEEGFCEKSEFYLDQALKNGFDQNKDIFPCSDRIDSIFKQAETIHQNNFNEEYRIRISSMFEKDQKFRLEENWKMMEETDSLNQLELLGLIEEYGFPSEKILGSQKSQEAFILLLHMDSDKNNIVMKPILDRAFKIGFIQPRSYAWIVDRRRSWGSEKREPYYYQMPGNRQSELSEEDWKEINMRRDSIGLPPK